MSEKMVATEADHFIETALEGIAPGARPLDVELRTVTGELSSLGTWLANAGRMILEAREENFTENAAGLELVSIVACRNGHGEPCLFGLDVEGRAYEHVFKASSNGPGGMVWKPLPMEVWK